MKMLALSRESAVALLLLAGAFRGSHAQTIRFVAPQDGSRLWVDDEHPVTLRFEVEGLALPQDGSIALVVNGRDTGHRINAPPFQVSMVEVEDRFFTVEAVLIDQNGQQTQIAARTSFFTRRALEAAAAAAAAAEDEDEGEESHHSTLT